MKSLYLILLSCLCFACVTPLHYDVVITNASLLDIHTGQIKARQTILINDGLIVAIQNNTKRFTTDTLIDAQEKLVSPSFIDTHVHPISEFADGDYSVVPDTLPQDSLAYYRNKLTAGFLPFGTTTILMMGHPPAWTPAFLEWTRHPEAKQVDVLTSGGALATEDGNTYPGHHRLNSPQEARQVVQEYYDLGVRNLKLYWRLRPPEFKAVIAAADSLGLRTFGHIGGFQDPTQLTISEALKMGLKDYEHLSILPCSLLTTPEDWDNFNQQFEAHFGKVDTEPLLLLSILEMFRYTRDHKKEAFDQLIDELATAEASISTTIGFLYQQYQATSFSEPRTAFSPEQIARSEENFAIMMTFAKRLHDKGIALRIGTDTKDGGQVLLLELQLLTEHGFTAADAMKIASYNGAKSAGIDHQVGSLSVGKQANLIIWEQSPLENPSHFTTNKIILKDGKIYH